MMTSKNTLLNSLNWNIESGADEIIAETPCNYFDPNLPTKIIKQTLSNPTPQKLKPQTDTQPTASPSLLFASTLDELKQAVLSCTDCNLKVTATHTVFGDGNPHAPVMLIGEAPGADEDRIGLPFVGKSGMLLDKMLASIGLSRTDNVYISNILPWRPPGNRTPTPNEVKVCLPFIQRHIELISPKILVLLGSSAAAALLSITDSISRTRGKWLKYTGIDTLITFHPAYLLRTPLQKKLSWQDMLTLKAKFDSLNLKTPEKGE